MSNNAADEQKDKDIIQGWLSQNNETNGLIKTNWYNDDGTFNDNFKSHIRGRLLFILAESNLKEKLKNTVKNAVNPMLDRSEARGTEYIKALQEILQLQPKTLGNYSVVGNAVGNAASRLSSMFSRKNVPNGGKHRKHKKTLRKIHRVNRRK